MTGILGIVAVFILMVFALAVAVGINSKYIEEENNALPPEHVKPSKLEQEAIKKEIENRRRKKREDEASKLVASDIEKFLLPQLKELQKRKTDVYLDIVGRELRVTTLDFEDYDYKYKIPLLGQIYYLKELYAQLDELGFPVDYWKDEKDPFDDSIAIYFSEY